MARKPCQANTLFCSFNKKNSDASYFIRILSRCFSFCCCFFFVTCSYSIKSSFGFYSISGGLFAQKCSAYRWQPKRKKAEWLEFMCDLVVVYFEIYFQMVVYLSEIYAADTHALLDATVNTGINTYRLDVHRHTLDRCHHTIQHAMLVRNAVPFLLPIKINKLNKYFKSSFLYG